MWNLFSAVKEREHGPLTGPGVYDEFTQDVFGSRFLTQRMEHRYCLNRETPISSLTFNCGGDLLCATFGERLILYDWEFNTAHNMFTSRNFKHVTKMKCLRSDNYDIEFITTGYDKKVRRALVEPPGNLCFSSIFVSPNKSLRFTLVPGDLNEIVLGSTHGDIFTVDLRRPPDSYANSITTVKHTNGEILSINGIIHHPFYPEVCVYGDDNWMHVYDKRNFGATLRKIYLGHENLSGVINQCAYNYNGSEFLGRCHPNGTFQVKNNNSGDILTRFKTNRKSCYFGPKSTHIVFCSSSSKLKFYDADTAELVKTVTDEDEEYLFQFEVNIVEPHPKLPVIATVSGNTGASIWSPPNVYFSYKPNILTELE